MEHANCIPSREQQLYFTLKYPYNYKFCYDVYITSQLSLVLIPAIWGTQELPSENQETLLYCEDDRALAEVIQEMRVPILSDIKGLSQHGPGKPILGHLLEQRDGPVKLQCFLLTTIIP